MFIVRSVAYFIPLFSLTLLLASGSSQAQETGPAAGEAGLTRLLSLEDCLSIAQVDNISLKQSRLGLEISLLDRIRAESAFDPGFEADFSGRGTPSSMEGSSDTTQLDLALKYSFPTWEGGNWIFSLNQSRSDGSTTGSSSAYTAYSSNLGVTYSMPLLEGYGDRINRMGVNRADLAVARSETVINNTVRSLRYAIIQTYINAVLAARAINVAELSLESATNLVEEVQARIDVGQLAPYELLSAQAGLAEREENLLNSKAAYKIALDSLKEIIGLPLTDEIEIDREILAPIGITFNEDELFLQAQKYRPDLQELDLRISQSQLDLLLAENRRQASLLWNTTFGLSGHGDGYNDSISDMENFSWYTGLEYRLSLEGNRAAVADTSTASIALQNLDLDRTNYLRTLQRDIRTAVENLNTALLRIDVTSQGLAVQETKIQSEQARLELGLITSRDLLEFDLEYANARLAYDRALADAFLAIAKIENLINQPLLSDAIMIGNMTSDGGES